MEASEFMGFGKGRESVLQNNSAGSTPTLRHNEGGVVLGDFLGKKKKREGGVVWGAHVPRSRHQMHEVKDETAFWKGGEKGEGGKGGGGVNLNFLTSPAKRQTVLVLYQNIHEKKEEATNEVTSMALGITHTKKGRRRNAYLPYMMRKILLQFLQRGEKRRGEHKVT